MKKKDKIIKATVSSDGVYECPLCEDTVYLDTYDLCNILCKGRILHKCPSCNNVIYLKYEPDNNSEL